MKRMFPSGPFVLPCVLAVCSCAIQPIRGVDNLKSLSDCQRIMSSMPEASWHDVPPPPQLGFVLAGSPSSGPTCILVAGQFAKSPSQFCSSAWRRSSTCFSHLGHCPGETDLYKHYCHLLLWASRSSGPPELLCPARTKLCSPSWSPSQLKEDGGLLPAQPHTTASLLQSVEDPTPFPTGRLAMLLFNFFFFQLPCWHCPSSPTGLTEPGAEALLWVMLNPMAFFFAFFFFFSIGKRLHWGKALPSVFQVVYHAPSGCREGSCGTWTPAQLLSPVPPGWGKASWVALQYLPP